MNFKIYLFVSETEMEEQSMCRKQEQKKCNLAALVGGIVLVLGMIALVCTLLARHTQRGRSLVAGIRAKCGCDPNADDYVN